MRRLVLLFFVSGLLGLGYQVLWVRCLLDFMGAGAWSWATVLAAFMGGLALGSAVLGPRADRVRSPLRLYAALEAGIGLVAFLYPRLLELVAAAYARWRAAGPEGAGDADLAAKAAAAGLLLLVPTTLMGGTYPAMLRHATRNLGLLGRRASQLYSANAAGAVAGSLLVAFVLMPALGTTRTLMTLALGNGLVALVALVFARTPAPEAPAPREEETSASALPPRGHVRLVLALIGVQGFLAFALEIAWTRFFSLVLGSSVYSFAVMLAAFISGIALGAAWLARRGHGSLAPWHAFAWAQVLAALCLGLALPFYPYLPWLLSNWETLLSAQDVAFHLYQVGALLVAFAVMLPPTVFLGMGLPLVLEGLGRDLGAVGRDAGRVWAWNTAGNVAGALLAGLVLLPALGMEGLLRAVAFWTAALGLVGVWVFGARRGSRWASLSALGAVAVLAAWVLGWGPWRRELFVVNPFRRVAAARSLAEVRDLVASRNVLLFEDDPAAHVMVYEERGTGARMLAVNGKVDASSVWDMPTQLLMAHVPLLLVPQARQVLVVGLASGVTSGAVLTHPVERLDAVDIVRSMPRATRLFDRWNYRALDDRRLHLVVDDARSFLSHPPRRYDVIISEPSNPWVAGVTGLYTREFYARAARALEDGGLYLQWLQAYEMSDASFAAVVRSFQASFPWVYGFQGTGADLLMIGSRRPLQPDWAEVERRFARPAVRTQLESLRIGDVETLLGFQQVSPATAAYLAATGEAEVTDDNHLLEYRAPRDLFRGEEVQALGRVDERLSASPSLLWSQYRRARPGNGSPRALLEALSPERVRTEPVASALQLASYHLGEPVPLHSVTAPFPPAELAERLERAAREGKADAVTALLRTYAPGVLLSAVLSPDTARFWGERAGRWGAEAGPALRRFRVDLLMASGREEDALREIRAWVHEVPAADVEWAAVRACQLGPAPCAEVVGAYAEWHAAPFVRRLQARLPAAR